MTARYLTGDILEVAPTLEPGSVDLIVSSPPFLAVRSYLPADHPDKAKEGGQQSTPGAYVDWLLDVVEAVAPCLAPHGSLVFELGDTYASDQGRGPDWLDGGEKWIQGNHHRAFFTKDDRKMASVSKFGNGWPRAKSKSLIPELFRVALTYGLNPLTGRTTDRWILRNVVTWCRPNPTPGALGDKVRPATSDIACFAKSGKRWFDLDAERTANPRVDETPRVGKWAAARVGFGGDGSSGPDKPMLQVPAGAPLLDWWELGDEQPPEPRPSTWGDKLHANPDNHRSSMTYRVDGNAPPLDFWVLPPGGYSGAHYAVWPPELVRRLINLMCPQRVCRQCGEPSRRIVEASPFEQRGGNQGGVHAANNGGTTLSGSTRFATDHNTLGWSDCGHADWRDGMVLDPFAGSGTTLAVASGMGRDSIGIDLDERNVTLARERVGMFLVEP